MEWLTPLTALYAGLIAVPLLLLLYFLKLKRRERIISSTLLWKRAVQDLQVNAPFQRLRHNILLLLQILALLALLLAMAGPVLSLLTSGAERYVLLIDRSASMSATDVEPSRLEVAKKQAKVLVESLRAGSFFSLTDESDQTMVIAFDRNSKVMCNFTADKQQLLAAIDSITPSDDISSLAEPIVVARAFAQSPGVEADIASAEEPAQLVLFSDGKIRDLDQIVVGADELVFHCIGRSEENVAITAMQARRSYENPDEVSVFATVANYGDSPVERDVQLSINDNVPSVRSVTVPSRRKPVDTGDVNQPGRVAVDFSLTLAEAGVLEVRQLPAAGGSNPPETDYLTCDDAAWSILPAPKRLSVLLVTNGNAVLESALRACSLARLDVNAPAEFEAMDSATFEIEQPYDFIVLDNYVPQTLPKCRYLVFGRPPNDIDVSVSQQLENQVLVDWRPKHPVLKYVNMMNLFAAKSYEMALPRDAEVLAEFNEAPAIAVVRRNGSIFLLVGFDVLESNWPFEPGFVLFCYNAATFLGTQVGLDQENNLNVGQPIVVDGLVPETTARIDGPGISNLEIKATTAGSVRFPATDRVGPYSLSIPDQQPRVFAVNLLDAKESNVAPRREIEFSGQAVQAEEQTLTRSNLPLWPFLVGLALVLVCLEWFVYTRKVRI
jgi:hypothetical protein